MSLCGEMARTRAVTLLVGLGLQGIQHDTRRDRRGQAGAVGASQRRTPALARRVLRLPTVDEIEQELLTALGRCSIPK